MTAVLRFFHILSLVYIEKHQLPNKKSDTKNTNGDTISAIQWNASWKLLYKWGGLKGHDSQHFSGPQQPFGISWARRGQFMCSGVFRLLGLYVIMVAYYDLINVSSYFELTERDVFPEATVFFRRLPCSTSTSVPITQREVTLRVYIVFSSILE
jgi:hypothetical protein